MRYSPLGLALSLGCGILSGCSQETETNTAPAPRPVTVIELREFDPVKDLQLTGSVKAWKEADVAFEVDGRVKWIVEMGTQLDGRWEENDEVMVTGDVLGRVDDATYQASLVAARAELEFAQITVAKVLPAELAEAEANLVNRQAEFDKVMGIPESAVEPIEPIRARANRDMVVAQVERAKAALTTGKAAVDKARAALKQTELDVQHSTLFAPFSAEVSKVHVEAGGYVTAGQAVAHLVMMDPIKIDLAVSPALAQRVKVHDRVHLLLPGANQPTSSFVYEKATVADPQTRTFRISIITRNQRDVSPAPDPAHASLARITRAIYFGRARKGDPTSPFMVEENHALRRDDNGWYVWAAYPSKPADADGDEHGILTLRRISVTPGERRFNFQGLYLFREIIEAEGLAPRTRVAFDVPDGVQDGDRVLLTQEEWRLRPGQLISVLLRPDVPVPGIYLPMNTIRPIDSESGDIFTVQEGRARKVRVKIVGNVGELFRIESADPADAPLVAAGSVVITNHIHFLQNNESVRIVRTVE